MLSLRSSLARGMHTLKDYKYDYSKLTYGSTEPVYQLNSKT